MKEYNFLVDNQFPNKVSKFIREKKDIIILLINSLEYIFMQEYIEEDNILFKNQQMLLHVDKMSRLFYFSDEKIYSINFPFNINIKGDKIYEIYDNNIILQFKHVSLLKTIFSNYNNSYIDELYSSILEENLSSNEENEILYLVTKLLLIEDGYFRYDFDVEKVNEEFHPINHIDLYFQSNNTFKIGLKEKIKMNDIINLSNNNSPCWFLSLPKK